MFNTSKIVRASILSLLLLFAGVSPGLSQGTGDCYRIKLQEQPLWISSATWIPEREGIFLIDPLRNKTMLFSPRGVVKDLPSEVEGEKASTFLPMAFSKTPTGYLLKMVDSRVLAVNSDLETPRWLNWAEASSGPLGRIGSLYEWTVAGDSLVAYGSLRLKNSARPYDLGFFRAPLSSLSEFEMLLPFENGDFYVLGHTNLATLGEDAYFLLMDKRPALYRVTADGAHRLKAFPKEFAIRPDLTTKMTGPHDAAAHFAEIERLRMPVGIWGHKGFLYLLAREPQGRGLTTWWLYKIDPRNEGRILGRMRLPTSAPHLTVVPSDDTWYIFERGRVGAQQQQQIAYMISLPARSIAGLSAVRSCRNLSK